MKERFYNGLDRFMAKFAAWFASPQGVMETFILTTIWTILEFVFPQLDPNGFKFLYICTVWGIQTQNILAYASNMSATEALKNQDWLVQIGKNNVDMMEAMLSMMESQEEMTTQIKVLLNQVKILLGDIAEDVVQIQEEIEEE